jgi:2-amino-4-hydroxy-6-hydroxymethyldihydropteridine diphosphokinase
MDQELAIIALGSNLGNSRRTLQEAIGRIQQLSAVPLLQSSFWETTPVDCPSGSPMFLNAVIALVPKSGETPETLFSKLQLLEKEFGRQVKKAVNEPRPLDLDLISFGDEVRSGPALILPHPRAHLRRFVLQPLAEIAPDLHLPGFADSVSDLLRELSSDEKIRKAG